MTPLDPKYHKRFMYSLTHGDDAIIAFASRSGSIWDITNDQMVYRFEVSDGKKISVCNFEVPSVKQHQIDLFDIADQAAKALKDKIHGRT